MPWYNLRHQQYQPNSAHGSHGYLLSTQMIISRISQMAARDRRGIIKYRNALTEMNNAERRDSVISPKTPDDEDNEEKPRAITARRDSVAAIHFTETGNTLSSQTEPIENTKPRTFKMRNAFRNLFRFRSKSEGSEVGPSRQRRPSEIADDALDSDASTGLQYRSTGQSMLQMPVQLKLGTDKTKLAVASVPEELECQEVYFGDSFTGGSCLKLNPSDRTSPEHRHIRLLQCEFRVEGALVVCVVTKRLAEAPRQHLNVQLRAEVGSEGALLQLQGAPMAEAGAPRLPLVSYAYPLPYGGERFRDLQRYLLLDQPGFYVPVENAFGWNVT